ncbi:unnamed protein product [Euphydryas editha]|uniref:Reverse transcriptase domain-containing protein n=1 Tax=Euphydryas editha TaxID=104508 RepID=A0AAU9UJB0_EUPED|nr:unnamed protein product [Euphydryas editha]
MYLNSTSVLWTTVGDTDPFLSTIGVHEDSALCPFLFNAVLDVVSAYIQDQPSWLIMYVDDIVLIDEGPLELECRVKLWKNTLGTGQNKCGAHQVHGLQELGPWHQIGL